VLWLLSSQKNNAVVARTRVLAALPVVKEASASVAQTAVVVGAARASSIAVVVLIASAARLVRRAANVHVDQTVHAVAAAQANHAPSQRRLPVAVEVSSKHHPRVDAADPSKLSRQG